MDEQDKWYDTKKRKNIRTLHKNSDLVNFK